MEVDGAEWLQKAQGEPDNSHGVELAFFDSLFLLKHFVVVEKGYFEVTNKFALVDDKGRELARILV